MKYLTLLNQTIELYLKGNLQEAYDLITQHQQAIIGVDAQLYNFRIAIAAKMGKKSLALKLLKEALMDKGYWYTEDILLEDDDFAILHSDETFKKLIQQASILKKEAKAKLEFTYEKTVNSTDKLLIVLHGNQLNNKIAKHEWYNRALDMTFGFLQSDASKFTNGYRWEDYNHGSKKLIEIYKDEQKNHKNIILGGFSAGAGVVLNTVLKDEISPQGIILFAPWVPTLQDDSHLLENLKRKQTKIFIMIGNQDDDCGESTQALIDALDEYKIAYQLEIIDNLSHEYPTDFQVYLKQALNYFEN